MPILIGDVSLTFGVSAAAAGAAEAMALALGAAVVGVVSASGPLHPKAATPIKQNHEATDQLFISCAPSKRCCGYHQDPACETLSDQSGYFPTALLALVTFLRCVRGSARGCHGGMALGGARHLAR